MIITNTKSVAQKIVSNGNNEDINNEIDDLAHNNAILVYITDLQGNILYSSDEFNGMRKRGFSADDNELKEKKTDKHQSSYRTLPDGYNEFLSRFHQPSHELPK